MAYVADRTRVVIAWSRYGWRVVIESRPGHVTMSSERKSKHKTPAIKHIFTHVIGFITNGWTYQIYRSTVKAYIAIGYLVVGNELTLVKLIAANCGWYSWSIDFQNFAAMGDKGRPVSSEVAMFDKSYRQIQLGSSRHVSIRLDTFNVSSPCILAVSSLCRTAQLDALVSTHSTRRTCRVVSRRDVMSQV